MPAASGFFCFSFSRAPPTEGRCKVAARALPGDRRDMLTINVKHNVSDAITRLDDLQKHVPFATALALTRTAQEVRKAEIEEMKRVFDRPTPFTLRSLYLKPATKADLTAVVWLKDDLNAPSGRTGRTQHYLFSQIYGGARRLKGFERLLMRKGLLPTGWMAVPGAGAKLDAYGNISGGQMVQILSALKALGEQGYAANRTAASAKRRRGKLRELFVGRPGGGRLPMGVWERFGFAHGSAVKPILIFVRGPRYAKRYDFFGVGNRTAARVFPVQFERALSEALGSAR
jgi:hypothetical protein